MDNCPICDDRGVLEKEGRLYECECSLLRRISDGMPPYIRKAEVLKKHLELGLIDKINKSYYIISAWADMRAIVKAVMIKHNKKHIRITSDREVRDVYVGSRSAAARAAMDDPEKIINTLEDLMDFPDLVVMRLNELSYKNKAAPGALEEALSYRTDRGKPTWIISDTNRPFGVGSHAYSESIWEFFQSSFETIQVPPISPKFLTSPEEVSPIMLTPITVPESETPKADPKPMMNTPVMPIEPPLKAKANPPKDKPVPIPGPKVKIQSIPDDEPVANSGIGMFGQGIQKPKKKFR